MAKFVCPYFEEVYICVAPVCSKDKEFTSCGGLVDGCLKVQDEEGRYFDEKVLLALCDYVVG